VFLTDGKHEVEGHVLADFDRDLENDWRKPGEVASTEYCPAGRLATS